MLILLACNSDAPHEYFVMIGLFAGNPIIDLQDVGLCRPPITDNGIQINCITNTEKKRSS